MLVAFSSTVASASAPTMADVDVIASATPLAVLGGVEGTLPEITDMLLGLRGGAIGETCIIALVLGFVYLVARRVIQWHTPVIFIGTVFVLSFLLGGFDVSVALYHVLSGGLFLGAIFMATDYSTTPTNSLGKMIFALGCGIITVLIRFFGSYPEGVSFAILFMNILAPFVEGWTARRPFGGAQK